MDNNSEEMDESVTQNELSVVDSQELDEEDLNAIKGDTIGDTVYSAKWIINTLISLSKVYDEGWTKALEDNLCMLWDMTAEKDIADFLMDNDFLRIAEFTIEVSKEPRLTEIVVGIIGNMCCQPAILEAVANASKLVNVIFGLLITDDPETLVQVLRLLQASVWDIQKNVQSKWLQRLKDCEFLGDAVTFILQSSTNDDLLTAAVDLIQSISAVQMPDDNSLLSDLFKVDQLMPALLESFTQLIPVKQDDDCHTRAELKIIENWLTIFSTVMQSEFQMFSGEKRDENVAKIMSVLLRILQPYRYSSNSVPLDDRVAPCVHECVEIIFWFQRNKMHPDAQIIHAIVAIMHGLRVAEKAEATDSFVDPDETIKELVKYLEKYWLETLSAYDEGELLEVVKMCDNDVAECLMEVAKEHSKESEDAVEKLLRVQSLR